MAVTLATPCWHLHTSVTKLSRTPPTRSGSISQMRESRAQRGKHTPEAAQQRLCVPQGLGLDRAVLSNACCGKKSPQGAAQVGAPWSHTSPRERRGPHAHMACAPRLASTGACQWKWAVLAAWPGTSSGPGAWASPPGYCHSRQGGTGPGGTMPRFSATAFASLPAAAPVAGEPDPPRTHQLILHES